MLLCCNRWPKRVILDPVNSFVLAVRRLGTVVNVVNDVIGDSITSSSSGVTHGGHFVL